MTSANRDKAISEQWSQIKSQWFRDLKPALLAQDKQGFYSDSTKYIDDVNRFVGALQDRNEQRQTWQQNLQILSLILSMIIMLIGVRRLQNSVLTPIQQLIKANRAFKEGKYDTPYSKYKINLIGLPFKVSEIEIDNEKIQFDKIAFESNQFLIVEKGFNELHITGE